MAEYYGFIHEKVEIKILILFILRRLPNPVTFIELSQLTTCDSGFSYFDYADCVADLIKTEHIKLEDDTYKITAKGERNSKVTENDLPFSVRMKAEKLAYDMRTAMNRNSMIKTAHDTNPDGEITVRLSLSDGVGDVVSMNLLAMSEKQAFDFENGFRNNAERIYHELVKLIIGG